MKTFPLAPVLGLAALTVVGCKGQGASSEDTRQSLMAAPPVESRKQYDSANLSCDPFGGGGPIYYNLGLAAKLYYSEPGTGPHWSSLNDYFTQGKKHPADLFFSDLNVPTRMWSAGFPSQAGPLLRSEQGAVLTEWFALRYNSVLRLPRNRAAGKFQLALVSDDGSLIRLDRGDGQGLKNLIVSDGLQSTKMSCASKTVFLDNSTYYPIQIDYFQGPRYEIAMMMLWREIPMNVNEESDPSALNDVACGKMGRDYFFDYNQTPSAPKQNFIDLLSRGWEIVPADAFVLPASDPENPCCEGGSCGIGV